MNFLRKTNFVLATVLSLAAGSPKLARVSSEADFFSDMGLGPAVLIAFGALQLNGGILMVLPASRKLGAVLAAVMFLASALMLLSNGQTVFGLFSVVPVAMAGLAAHNDGWRSHSPEIEPNS